MTEARAYVLNGLVAQLKISVAKLLVVLCQSCNLEKDRFHIVNCYNRVLCEIKLNSLEYENLLVV